MYCNFLISKLHHLYISLSFTKFSEDSSLLNHLQEHSLSISKSKHVILGNIFFWKLHLFKIKIFITI